MRPPPWFSAGLPESAPARSAQAHNCPGGQAYAKNFPPLRQFCPEESTICRRHNTAQATVASVRRRVEVLRWLAPGPLALPNIARNSNIIGRLLGPVPALVGTVAAFAPASRNPPAISVLRVFLRTASSWRHGSTVR